MKESPLEKFIHRDMSAGRLSKEGFLGDDNRTPEQIIQEDAQVLQRLGVTAEEVGRKMRRLTRAGMEGLGDPIQYAGYEIEVDEWKGTIPCPFKDARKSAKRHTKARRLRDGLTMEWSDLSIHLIEAHGFFQGKGASYRLEPADLLEFLDLL